MKQMFFILPFLILSACSNQESEKVQPQQEAPAVLDPMQERELAAQRLILNMLEAVQFGDTQKVAEYLAQGIDVNAKLSDYEVPADSIASSFLCEAVKTGKEDMVAFLITNGASANAICNETETALNEAVKFQNRAIIKTLIGAGANVNGPQNDNPQTPLLIATQNRDITTVMFLVESGADVNLSTGAKSPMTEAAQSDTEILKFLLGSKANPDAEAKTQGFAPPLYYAVKANNQEAVQILLAQGANPNLYGTEELFCMDAEFCYTPLMQAAKNNNLNLATILIAAGADKTITTPDKKTALTVAVENNAVEVIPLLEKAVTQKI